MRPPEQQVLSRRQFLKDIIYAVGGVIAATLAYPAVRYFIYPAVRKSPAEPFSQAASLADFTVGVPTFITYEERVQDGWATVTHSKGAWVVYNGGNNIVVFDPHCTHLGCGYSWNAGRKLFLCPCHGGVFDINGNVVAGPPPRPLDHIEYQINQNALLLGPTIRASQLKG